MKRKIIKHPPGKRIEDPDEMRVQLNIQVPRWQRDHLMAMAATKGVSLSQLCRDQLNKSFPVDA